MLLIALGYILTVLVLLDLEPEYPLFHVQDHLGGTRPHSGYYLCYLYPRPWYYVERVREWIKEIDEKVDRWIEEQRQQQAR